jgi:hypothetical protein
MKIRPELMALRVDDGPQRLAQQALAEQTRHWSHASGLAVAEGELQRFAAGAALDDLPVLCALFTPGDPTARELVDGLIASQARQLQAMPLGQVILRHYIDEMTSALSLARSGTATLTLQAVDGMALDRRGSPESVSFSPSESYCQVLAGTADVEIIMLGNERPDGADLLRHNARLAPGQVNHRIGSRETVVLQRVETSLVMLTLQRRVGEGAVTREFMLADGALVHQAAGSPRDSRLELSAALLGRMGRADAAPMLAAMAEEEAARSLRWQALRECLGLDSAVGFAALSRIARAAGDPLAGPAGALRAQLLETYPELAGLLEEETPCLA